MKKFVTIISSSVMAIMLVLIFVGISHLAGNRNENVSIPAELLFDGREMNEAARVNGYIKVGGFGGSEGWVLARELVPPMPKNPEEAVARQNAREEYERETGFEYRFIDVFDIDWKTVIDKFKVFSAKMEFDEWE